MWNKARGDPGGVEGREKECSRCGLADQGKTISEEVPPFGGSYNIQKSPARRKTDEESRGRRRVRTVSDLPPFPSDQ